MVFKSRISQSTPLLFFIFLNLNFINLALAQNIIATGDVVINEIVAETSERLLKFENEKFSLGSGIAWNTLNYEDEHWQEGSGPFGYGVANVSTDVESEIKNITPSLYLRKKFNVSADTINANRQLELSFDVDDGFVAFLNGVEIFRTAMGPAGMFVYHDQLAFVGRSSGVLDQKILIGSANQIVVEGENVLAIQAHNFELDSGGFFIEATLHEEGAVNALVNATDNWKYFIGTREPSGNLVDEDGDVEDWVELYNRGSQPVSLNGWSLTDDSDTPGKWIFPDIQLAPQEYLIVFCSGKDRKTGAFHTGFNLSKGGEFLGLFNDQGTAEWIATPAFPDQLPHYSWGRHSADAYGFLDLSTPGSSNLAANFLFAIVNEPEFGLPQGVYEGQQSIAITCETPGAEIYFTTNGDDPTKTSGTLYENPILLSNTVTPLRARAFVDGWIPSEIRTRTYFINLEPWLKSLPLLTLNGDNEKSIFNPYGLTSIGGGEFAIDGKWSPTNIDDYHIPMLHGRVFEKPCAIGLIDTDNSSFQLDAGLRIAGSDFRRPRYQNVDDFLTNFNGKYSFRAYFRNDYGRNRLEHNLFDSSPLNSFKVLTFRSGHNDFDNPFLIDELTRRLHIQMGGIISHGIFANLFLNGKYRGLYNPVERIDETFLNDWYGTNSDWDIIRAIWPLNYETVEVQEGDTLKWNELFEFINATDFSEFANYQQLQNMFDVESFIDFLILHSYCATEDQIDNNWVAYRERIPNGKFIFATWDAEKAFGNSDLVVRNPDYDFFVGDLNSGIAAPANMFQQLRVSPEFRLTFSDHIHRHFFKDGTLTDQNILSKYQELKNKIQPTVETLYGPFDNSIEASWIPQRRGFLFPHFVREGLWSALLPPTSNITEEVILPGFEVIFTNPNSIGDIYYTVDGSDPRVAGSGEISNSAIHYAGAIRATKSEVFRARVFDGTNWSALEVGRTSVLQRQRDIIITEIFINADGNDDGKEWFEIYNRTDFPIDLNGWEICDNHLNSHIITSASPLIIPPRSYFVLGQSKTVLAQNDVFADYEYGFLDLTLGNNSDELILKQNNFVIHSIGWGDFERFPNTIMFNLFQDPKKEISLGRSADPDSLSKAAWAYQCTAINSNKTFATPGIQNNNEIDCFDSNIDLHLLRQMLGVTIFESPLYENLDLNSNSELNIEDLNLFVD